MQKRWLAESLHNLSIRNRPISYLPTKCKSDVILILLLVGLSIGFVSYWHECMAPLQTKVEIDLSPLYLPKYAFYSMTRGLIGYLFSLVFSLLCGFWAAKDRMTEKIMIPILDSLQSIPVLGFMPGLIFVLLSIFPSRNIGLELASILMIFSSQAWNMAFSIYHSIKTVPQDKKECAVVYKLSHFQKIRFLEMPCTVIGLVWNSIMSMSGGWFFLMLSEAFQLGDRDFRVPGLGSYMSVAANKGDLVAMLWAIFAMVFLIVFLDQFLWKPLVVWSQKFRLEETSPSFYADSWFLHVLKHSCILEKLGSLYKNGQDYIHDLSIKKAIAQEKKHKGLLSSSLLFCILSLAFYGVGRLILLVTDLQLDQWLYLAKMALFTLGRVFACVGIAALWTLPLGLAIGLSEKLSRFLQPALQIAASFPATLLFPILIWILMIFGVSLQIGSVLLMLLGTQWYIMFNVIAGAKAMPSDLKEVAENFHVKGWKKWKSLYLPAIFPHLITGMLTAAGGAWNASIVAEYVSYKGQTWSVEGLGSSINIAAQSGNIPLLVASILVMALVVVVLNFQLWLKLYHYSENRFALNY